jgi:hypothetical protein
MKTLATDCTRIEMIAKDSTLTTVNYPEVFDGATVDPEAIVKFVLAEGKGTLA